MEEAIMATGRRKNAVARVRLIPGTGKVVVNERNLSDYFGNKVLEQEAMAPLKLTEMDGRYDCIVKVEGGGLAGQAGAMRHGVARALIEIDENLREPLKRAGYLTRDPRMKERRKYGLKKARKAPQFSKR